MEWRLFVDDDRVGPQDKHWRFATNFETAISLIEKNGIPIDISLDHDIWTGAIQGVDFVLWFEEYVNNGNKLPEGFEYSIHSTNQSGSAEMQVVMARLTGKEPKYLKQWW